MVRVGLVCLVSFLVALIAVLGLDVYTAKRPDLDESGFLSNLHRFARTAPSRARAKSLKVHSAHVVPARKTLLSPVGHLSRRPRPIDRMYALHVASPQIADRQARCIS